MKRRGVLAVLLVGLTGAWWAQAQTAPRANLLVMATASTPRDFPYQVTVEVVAENRGQAASPEGQLELTLRPQAPRSSRPKSDVPTMWDPVVEAQPLPALQPGEKKVFTFNTPYQSRNSFKSARGSFKANNIEATQADVTVQMSTRVQ